MDSSLDPDSSVGVVPPMTPASAAAAASVLKSSRRYALGIVLLLLVVVLWVGSSTLIQTIFVDQNFRQPLFLTYYSTSLFTLYLPVWAIHQWLKRQHWWPHVTRCCRSERERMRQGAVLLESGSDNEPPLLLHSAAASPGGQLQPFASLTRYGQVAGDETPNGGRNHSASSSPRTGLVRPTPVIVSALTRMGERSPLTQHGHSHIVVVPHQLLPSAADAAASGDAGDSSPTGASLDAGSIWATARLALALCPLWFLMNYLFNLSLNLTSLASSTILSTTSSLFVLLFGLCTVPRAAVGLPQVLGVAATILGAVLISWKDTESGSGGAGSEGEEGMTHSLVGDLVAALSAVFYALYSLQLRRSIPDETAVDMTLLFGFIGLTNALFAWPLFPLLHLFQIESWVGFPSLAVVGFLTLNGLAGTVVSDFLWAKSVLLTSPLIASLGLALTVPLAIVVDIALNGKVLTWMRGLGGCCVLAGFALVNVAHKKKIEEEETGAGAAAVQVIMRAQEEQEQEQQASQTRQQEGAEADAGRGRSSSHSDSSENGVYHHGDGELSNGTSPFPPSHESDDAALLDVSLSSPAVQQQHSRSREVPAGAAVAGQNTMHAALASDDSTSVPASSAAGAEAEMHKLVDRHHHLSDHLQAPRQSHANGLQHGREDEAAASGSLESQLASALTLDHSETSHLEQHPYDDDSLEHALATPQDAPPGYF